MVEKGESRTPMKMPGSLVGLLGLGHKEAQRSAKRIALCAFCAFLWLIWLAHDHRLHSLMKLHIEHCIPGEGTKSCRSSPAT